MAPKKKNTQSESDVLMSKMTDLLMQSARDAGVIATPYSQHAKTLRVLPIPSLALQWLINSNGWPLGRMTSSAGDPKTFKSTFGHQLMAWFLMAGGYAYLLDTEGKQNGETMTAIVDATGMDPLSLAMRCMVSSVSSMDQWQAVLLNYSKGMVETLKSPDNCPFPYLHVLDSLTGANSQAATDELVENDGGVAMSRVGQQNAKALYQFMRDGSRRAMEGMTDSAIRWPSTLHLVSHQRDRGDGLKGKTRSGGVSADFYTTLDLVFTRGGTSAYNASFKKTPDCGKKGRIISINVRYSSMGPDGNDQTISVPVLAEWVRDEVGCNHSVLVYDWGAADTFFLAHHYNEVKAVMDLETKVVRGHGMFAKSDTVGFKDFVPASEFGYALQADADLMQTLRNEMGITTREPMIYTPWVGGRILKPTVQRIDVDNPPPPLPDGISDEEADAIDYATSTEDTSDD